MAVKYDKILGALRESDSGGTVSGSYNDLTDKPSIGGVVLEGDTGVGDLGAVEKMGVTDQFETGAIKTSLATGYKYSSLAKIFYQSAIGPYPDNALIFEDQPLGDEDITDSFEFLLAMQGYANIAEGTYKANLTALSYTISGTGSYIVVSDDEGAYIADTYNLANSDPDVSKPYMYKDAYEDTDDETRPASVAYADASYESDIQDEGRYFSLTATQFVESTNQIIVDIPTAYQKYVIQGNEIYTENDPDSKYIITDKGTTNNYITIDRALDVPFKDAVDTKIFFHLPKTDYLEARHESARLIDLPFIGSYISLGEDNELVRGDSTIEQETAVDDEFLLINTSLAPNVGDWIAVSGNVGVDLPVAYKALAVGSGGVVDIDRPVGAVYPEDTNVIIIDGSVEDMEDTDLFKSVNLGIVKAKTDELTADYTEKIDTLTASVEENATEIEGKVSKAGDTVSGLIYTPVDEDVNTFTAVPIADFSFYDADTIQNNYVIMAQGLDFNGVPQDVSEDTPPDGELARPTICVGVTDTTTVSPTVYMWRNSGSDTQVRFSSDAEGLTQITDDQASALSALLKSGDGTTGASMYTNIESLAYGDDTFAPPTHIQDRFDLYLKEFALSLATGYTTAPTADTVESISFLSKIAETTNLAMQINGVAISDFATQVGSVALDDSILSQFTVTAAEWLDIVAADADKYTVEIVDADNTSSVYSAAEYPFGYITLSDTGSSSGGVTLDEVQDHFGLYLKDVKMTLAAGKADTPRLVTEEGISFTSNIEGTVGLTMLISGNEVVDFATEVGDVTFGDKVMSIFRMTVWTDVILVDTTEYTVQIVNSDDNSIVYYEERFPIGFELTGGDAIDVSDKIDRYIDTVPGVIRSTVPNDVLEVARGHRTTTYTQEMLQDGYVLVEGSTANKEPYSWESYVGVYQDIEDGIADDQYTGNPCIVVPTTDIGIESPTFYVWQGPGESNQQLRFTSDSGGINTLSNSNASDIADLLNTGIYPDGAPIVMTMTTQNIFDDTALAPSSHIRDRFGLHIRMRGTSLASGYAEVPTEDTLESISFVNNMKLATGIAMTINGVEIADFITQLGTVEYEQDVLTQFTITAAEWASIEAADSDSYTVVIYNAEYDEVPNYFEASYPFGYTMVGGEEVDLSSKVSKTGDTVSGLIYTPVDEEIDTYTFQYSSADILYSYSNMLNSIYMVSYTYDVLEGSVQDEGDQVPPADANASPCVIVSPTDTTTVSPIVYVFRKSSSDQLVRFAADSAGLVNLSDDEATRAATLMQATSSTEGAHLVATISPIEYSDDAFAPPVHIKERFKLGLKVHYDSLAANRYAYPNEETSERLSVTNVTGEQIDLMMTINGVAISDFTPSALYLDDNEPSNINYAISSTEWEDIGAVKASTYTVKVTDTAGNNLYEMISSVGSVAYDTSGLAEQGTIELEYPGADGIELSLTGVDTTPSEEFNFDTAVPTVVLGNYPLSARYRTYEDVVSSSTLLLQVNPRRGCLNMFTISGTVTNRTRYLETAQLYIDMINSSTGSEVSSTITLVAGQASSTTEVRFRIDVPITSKLGEYTTDGGYALTVTSDKDDLDMIVTINNITRNTYAVKNLG